MATFLEHKREKVLGILRLIAQKTKEQRENEDFVGEKKVPTLISITVCFVIRGKWSFGEVVDVQFLHNLVYGIDAGAM